MHCAYDDIRMRIAEEPKWFDEYAVPRYCDFHPNEVANIYADEVVLMEIACQVCGKHFLKATSQDDFKRMMGGFSLADRIKDRDVYWNGDPPNIWCCPAGPSMTSETICICEYWTKDEHYEWVRKPEYEIILDTAYEE